MTDLKFSKGKRQSSSFFTWIVIFGNGSERDDYIFLFEVWQRGEDRLGLFAGAFKGEKSYVSAKFRAISVCE